MPTKRALKQVMALHGLAVALEAISEVDPERAGKLDGDALDLLKALKAEFVAARNARQHLPPEPPKALPRRVRPYKALSLVPRN